MLPVKQRNITHNIHPEILNTIEYKAIKIICFESPEILSFIFHSNKPFLRHSTEQLLKQVQGYSKGQLVLLKISLDIWTGSTSYSSLNDIIHSLDTNNFENVMRALTELRRGSIKFI